MLKRTKWLTFYTLFFLLLFGIIGFGQDNQVNDDDKIKEEILAVYKSEGEDGLRDFTKEKIDDITPKFIANFAEAGVNERKEDWLKISLILAEEKKDEKIIAFVHFEMGRYFYSIGNERKGIDYYEKALPILKKINNPDLQEHLSLIQESIHVYKKEDFNKMEEIIDRELPKFEEFLGQANIYIWKGNLYAYKGDNLRAFEMYDKAISIFEKEEDINGQGKVYLSKGDIYRYKNNYRKGLEMYDKALPFFEKAGNIEGQGKVYKNKGDIYRHTGENLKSLEMYDKALQFFEKAGNIEVQGEVYKNKGDIYRLTGDNSKSFEMYEKALLYFEKAGNIEGQGKGYMGKGDIYQLTGDNSKALKMYEKALEFFEITGVFTAQGFVYLDMGEVYLKNGENSRALDMNKKALNFFKKANNLFFEGYVYVKNANIYYFKNCDTSLALEMYEKALIIFKKLLDYTPQGFVLLRKGDIFSSIGDNSNALEMYNQALDSYKKGGGLGGQILTYISKGDFYSKIYEFPRALEMFYQAQEVAEKNGCLHKGLVCLSNGDICYKFGDYSRMKEMYKEAETIFKKTGDSEGMCYVYYGMGNFYTVTGDYPKAEKIFDELLAKIDDVGGDNVVIKNVLVSKGDIYLRNGNYYIAKEMYERASLFHNKRFKNTVNKWNVYSRMGDIHFWNGDNSKAMEMYDKALSFHEKSGEIESLSYILHRKAQVLAKLGKNDEALSLFEKAIKKLEKIRRKSALPWIKMSFMEKVYEQYQETAFFMLENNYHDKGFKYAESMKARVFLDQLYVGLEKLEKGINQELLQKRYSLIARQSLLSKKISEAAYKNDEEALKKLKDKYRETENEFEDLMVKILLENPLYASVQYPEPVTLNHLQQNILKKGEILLQYFVTSEKVYVFLISKMDFQVVALVVKESDIKRFVNRYLLSMKFKDSEKLIKYGKVLYQSLCKPLEPELWGIKDIIIVPDSELAKIPFESFVVGDREQGKPMYLLKRYHIKYIQSASVLSTLRTYYRREGKSNQFIGFGDPVYDYENFQQRKPEKGAPVTSKGDIVKEIHRGKYNREGGMHHRLPGSGQEVEAIAGLFKEQDQKSVIYLRDKANEENAKAADMKNYDYIHFSCHGILGDGFQSLVLSQLPTAKEDGYLTLNEIMNCDYHAKLVVLSACQTGTGKMERAEGVTGLTRAVMYAGTPAVVASLWNVSEMGTKELMVKFYSNILKKKMSKEEALRQAKLEMIKEGNYSSPYFWSAFVMYGE